MKKKERKTTHRDATPALEEAAELRCQTETYGHLDPDRTQRLNDLADALEAGEIAPSSGENWDPETGPPSEQWLSKHRERRALLVRKARERGEEPSPCWCGWCLGKTEPPPNP